MKTLIFKKSLQTLLGVLVLGIAALSQSFTKAIDESSKSLAVHRFYNTSPNPSTNPSDYEYQIEDPQLCSDNPDNVCSAEWDIGTATPSVGQAPPANATLVAGSEQEGDFNQ